MSSTGIGGRRSCIRSRGTGGRCTVPTLGTHFRGQIGVAKRGDHSHRGQGENHKSKGALQRKLECESPKVIRIL